LGRQIQEDCVTPQQRIRQVADEFGVTVEDLISERRTKLIVIARQELMLRMKEEDDLSLKESGKFLNRHHSTVLQGIRRARKRRAKK
jgi:chromosomal replication initiator protein